MTDGIKVTVDAAQAQAALSRMASGMENRTVPNRQLAAQFQSWVYRNFESEGSLRLGGKGWDQLKPSTANAYLGGGKWTPLVVGKNKKGQRIRRGYHPILIVTGQLRQSFQGFSDNDQAGIGARASFGVDYAKVHEYGNARVKARPMLPTPAVALDYAVRVYNLHIGQTQQKAGL